MRHDYGYVHGTEGSDEDHVDVFVGPDPESEFVVVIDQVDPATSQFDEVKVMLGFNSLEAAKAGYLSNYEKGWKGIGDATAVTVSQFKDWLEHGNTKQNFATYAEKAWKAKTAAMIPTSAWQHVPQLVKERYKEAASIQQAIAKIIRKLPPLMPGYGDVYWHPVDKTAWIVCGDGDTEQEIQRWHNALQAIPGVLHVKSEAEYGPYGDSDWIRIKRAADESLLNLPYRLAGHLTGGPSPLSNALVTGLLGAGAGYLGGSLLERTMPSEYFEEGTLRRNLAIAGGALGAGVHLPQAFANAAINQKATGKPHWLRSILGSESAQQLDPHELDWKHHLDGGQKRAAWQTMIAETRHLPPPSDLFLRTSYEFVKNASLDAGLMNEDVPLRAVPVDAFNNAIWNDVHQGARSSQANPYGTRSPYSNNTDDFHTPAVNAAAATGLVSGIQQMYGNRPLLSPQHFISGLANAGVDLYTARAAGGILGALGGLRPEAQKKLQEIGLWSGMIRGVTGSVLGLP